MQRVPVLCDDELPVLKDCGLVLALENLPEIYKVLLLHHIQTELLLLAER